MLRLRKQRDKDDVVSVYNLLGIRARRTIFA